VIVPLGALAARGVSGGVWAAISNTEAADALILSLWCSLLAALVNGVMGLLLAWVLVRYRFPGRSLLSALVDLPFAIPTLVAGVLLVMLFGPQSAIRIAYTPAAIVLALLFVTLPLVVRSVEPVLEACDPAEEEAARTLGAGPATLFRRVILPAIAPALLCGIVQSFARALAEFGSIVAVSGNIPHRTLTAPVHVFGQVEGGHADSAAAVSLVLLALALLLTLVTRRLSHA
jgi:sulfate transport system permease protein